MSFFILKHNIKGERDLFVNDIKTSIISQKSLILSEIFFKQNNSYKSRLKLIQDQIELRHPKFKLCLLLKFAEGDLSHNTCGSNKLYYQSLPEFEFILGDKKLATLYFADEIVDNSFSILVKIILSTSLIAGLISSVLIFFLGKLIELKIVTPLLNSIKAQSKTSAIGKMASQVAHDIRSPLAALNMVIKDISEIEEEKRIIIRGSVNRIQDIANELLEKNRKINQASEKETKLPAEKINTLALISSLLEIIISEKRMQYRSKLGIEIEYRPLIDSYGLFALVSPHEFKRVINNAINNAIEALGETGRVSIQLSSMQENIHIQIIDNGKGIPPEILKRLGKKMGETHGKQEGNGLGLYHAKTNVESWSGKLYLESEMGKGTTLNIIIPKAKSPEWFVPRLIIKPQQHIVILDDDSSIHQIWDSRFFQLHLKEKNVEIHHFSTPEQIENWFIINKNINNVIYLFDFELLNQKLNGLQVIEKLGIAGKAILVTSRFEEKKILDSCQNLGVRIIPKNMAESVPIKIDDSDFQSTDLSNLSNPTNYLYDTVYIDDDELLRWGWSNSAVEKK